MHDSTVLQVGFCLHAVAAKVGSLLAQLLPLEFISNDNDNSAAVVTTAWHSIQWMTQQARPDAFDGACLQSGLATAAAAATTAFNHSKMGNSHQQCTHKGWHH